MCDSTFGNTERTDGTGRKRRRKGYNIIYDSNTQKIAINKDERKGKFVTEKCTPGNQTKICCKHIDETVCITDKISGNKYYDKSTTYHNCQSMNVIYCITCTVDSCQMKYVGETKRKLSDRLKEHIRDIKQNTKNTHLVHHFNNDHSLQHLKIKVLNSFDNANKQDLLTCELEYIKLLNTAYPYGLNENIKGLGNMNKDLDYKQNKTMPYMQYKTQRRKRSHGKKRNKYTDNGIHQTMEVISKHFEKTQL